MYNNAYNYGSLDVFEAMRWIHRNIATFGGDPDRVTVYGQSAGSYEVSLLMTSPLAKGLFRQAILQSSGAVGIDRPPPEAAERAGTAFARRWGIDGTGPAALASLRALTPEQIADGLHIGTRASQSAMFSGPVTDGKIVTESLVRAVGAARQAHVPLLIGSTTGDNYATVQGSTAEEAFRNIFGGLSGQANAAYLAGRPDPDVTRLLHDIGRDLSYAEPARYIATKFADQNLPVFVYRYGYVPNVMAEQWTEGPPHATDIPFTMDTVQAKYGDKATAADAGVARLMHTYWVNFVKTGDPNGKGLPTWSLFQPATDTILTIDEHGRAASGPDPRKAELDVVAAMRHR